MSSKAFSRGLGKGWIDRSNNGGPRFVQDLPELLVRALQQKVPGLPGTVGPGGRVPGLPNTPGLAPPAASGLPPAAAPDGKP